MTRPNMSSWFDGLAGRVPDPDLDDIPGFLEERRRTAVMATFYFFTALLVYQVFGRPYQTTPMFWGNLVLLVVNLVGLVVILSGRLRAGLLLTVYALLAANVLLQVALLRANQVGPVGRVPAVSGLMVSLQVLYTMVVAGFCLARRHVLIVGGVGLAFLALAAGIVRDRVFTDLMLLPAAYLLAGTIFIRYFIGLFETIVGRLTALSTNLHAEVAARTRALEESEQRHRLLFANASLGLFRTAPDGRISYANGALARLLGFRDAAEAMESAEPLDSYYADATSRETVLRMASDSEHPVTTVVRFRRRDGTTFPADLRFRVVRDPSGRIEAYEGFVDDITKRVEAEAEIRTAKDRAEQASAAKSIFLAKMSHDLRTPLNSIMGFSELLLRRLDDDVARRHASIIHEAGEELRVLVDDLLDLSRIEAGALVLKEEPTDVRALLRSVGRHFAAAAERKRLEYRESIDASVPERVLVDASRLRQVLMNLVGNAVKFTSAGSVFVEATMGGTGSGEERLLILRVEDTGCGIPLEAGRKIFELFYQADGAHRGGVGLGLAIARQLAGLMRGTLEFTSEVGIGSRFTFSLPVAAVLEGERARHAGASPGGERFEGTCLIVDDIEANRIFLKECLADTGLTLREAVSGEEALDEIARTIPDIVLLDLRLPGIDGYEVMRRLPASSRRRVIAVTASALPDDELRVIEAGFFGLLQKPFSRAALVAQITRALEPARARVAASRARGGLASDWAALAPAPRERISELVEAAHDSGGIRQMKEVGVALQAMTGPDLASLGRDLVAAADACDLATLRDRMAQVKELFVSDAPSFR